MILALQQILHDFFFLSLGLCCSSYRSKGYLLSSTLTVLPKQRLKHTLSKCTMTPFLTALSVTVAQQTRAHAHERPHTAQLGESKGAFVTGTFISFSLVALRTETHSFTRSVQCARSNSLLFSCDFTLVQKQLISWCLSAVRGWSIHCACLTLWSGNEGAGRRGQAGGRSCL